MTSGAWSNDSTIGLDEYGMIQSCVAVTLPAIGLERSLIIILGGTSKIHPSIHRYIVNSLLRLGSTFMGKPNSSQ